MNKISESMALERLPEIVIWTFQMVSYIDYVARNVEEEINA